MRCDRRCDIGKSNQSDLVNADPCSHDRDALACVIRAPPSRVIAVIGSKKDQIVAMQTAQDPWDLTVEPF